jgi:hypothetical protein
MATWAEFETAAPELAAVAARLWPGVVGEFRVAYIATTRRDGSPRLHPFCPIVAAGRLWAAIPRTSPKGWDLRRDSRCVIHAALGADDDELCIRAHATEMTDDRDARNAVLAVVEASGVGGMIETASSDALFEFDLDRVDVAYWVDIGQPGTRAVRQRWTAP